MYFLVPVHWGWNAAAVHALGKWKDMDRRGSAKHATRGVQQRSQQETSGVRGTDQQVGGPGSAAVAGMARWEGQLILGAVARLLRSCGRPAAAGIGADWYCCVVTLVFDRSLR